MILVDWDDTLFATTWLAGKSEFKSWQREWVSGAPPKLSEEDARDLAELDKAARAFLCAASALGQALSSHVFSLSLSAVHGFPKAPSPKLYVKCLTFASRPTAPKARGRLRHTLPEALAAQHHEPCLHWIRGVRLYVDLDCEES